MKIDEESDFSQPLTYSIYGFNVDSNFQFTHHITTSINKPNLKFRITDTVSNFQNWEEALLLFPSNKEQDLGIYLYSLNKVDLLRFSELGDFYLQPEEILFHSKDFKSSDEIEIQFLGSVLSFWLERQNIPALHASAIVLENNCAVGFLASSKGGKSTLAFSLVQSGYPLLTDDILPVEIQKDLIFGRPGYAQMRLWPDQAKYFLGNYENLVPVYPNYPKLRVPIGSSGWGNFCSKPQLLKCLYLPERRDPLVWGTEVKIIDLSPQESLFRLAQQSFAAPILRAMNILPRRLQLLAQIVEKVPVRKIIYPNGMEYLPLVENAIKSDLF